MLDCCMCSLSLSHVGNWMLGARAMYNFWRQVILRTHYQATGGLCLLVVCLVLDVVANWLFDSDATCQALY